MFKTGRKEAQHYEEAKLLTFHELIVVVLQRGSLACHPCSQTKAKRQGEETVDVADQRKKTCLEFRRSDTGARWKYLSCFLLLRSWPAEERKAVWSSWFCQYLGVPIPKLQQSESPQLVCPCHKHIIDVHGDHIHTCSSWCDGKYFQAVGGRADARIWR